MCKFNYKYYFINILCLLTTQNLNCVIREASTIKDVLGTITALNRTKKIITIFDLDNTLVRGKTSLSSDEFFALAVEGAKRRGLSEHDAIAQALPDYCYVQFHSPLYLVEPDAPDVLQQLRQNGIPTMASTARSYFLCERTIHQIQANNIVFDFFADRSAALKIQHPAIFKKGMLFTGLNNKYDGISELFRHLEYIPEYVIAIDDKSKNLLDLEKGFSQQGVDFYGLRFNACDHLVAQATPEGVEQELQEFKEQKRRKIYDETDTSAF